MPQQLQTLGSLSQFDAEGTNAFSYDPRPLPNVFQFDSKAYKVDPPSHFDIQLDYPLVMDTSLDDPVGLYSGSADDGFDTYMQLPTDGIFDFTDLSSLGTSMPPELFH